MYILRGELRRLFRWLTDKGVTAVITGETGDGALTRHGSEEYESDCVIQLDHRVENQVSTRRLRIVKYRGATHGTHEYPFLIDEDGISVLPVTSLGLQHEVSNESDSGGVPRKTFATNLDVTERKRAGQEFRGLLESAPAAMVIIDGKLTVPRQTAREQCRKNKKRKS